MALILRSYQVDISSKASKILTSTGIVYLSCQVRTGKSLMALETCKLVKAKKVLFITKIKAFSSIQGDYEDLSYDYELKVINKESVHKLTEFDYDVVVLDEAHQYGAFPKTGKFQKLIRKKFGHIPIIFMSGTMSPESYSQIYHQLQISARSPFKKYTTFYKWAVDYVKVKKKFLGYAEVNDYSDADIDKIMSVIKDQILTFTQEQAGFTSSVDEEVMYVDMKPQTHSMCRQLSRDLIIQGKNEVVIADTAVKLQQKLHQMYSGTVKFESGKSMVFDLSKAEFIKWKFQGSKIGIFYKFKAEFDALSQVFGGENLTNDLDEFNRTDKNIALQIVSGREGISLKEAEYLVFYNIDFSATSYYQAKDRLTTMDRKFNKVYWIFARGGIEDNIYRAVMNKKNYTLSHFKKDYKL